jgi:hypothetical protein
MEQQNKRGGRRSYQPGRPRKTLDERTARHDGKYAFWISGEHALKLQTLMLRDVPGVGTPDQMIEHLIDEAQNS